MLSGGNEREQHNIIKLIKQILDNKLHLILIISSI